MDDTELKMLEILDTTAPVFYVLLGFRRN